MMKFATKFLVVGAVAAMAIAMSVGSSEAAKHKRMASKSCGSMGALCATNCANGWCSAMFCSSDGTWIPAYLTPVCPQGVCINVRKKC